MRTVMVSRRILGWPGLLAIVAVAGCTATSTSSPAAPGHGQSASPAATTALPPRAASGAAPAGPGGVRNLTSQTYAVRISIPVGWQPTPHLGGFGYDGTSGWMELNAATEPSGLHQACTDVATGNVLHPYGLHPLITYRSINGRPGCLILPSRDASALARRAGGPAFQNSAALVEYRQPIPVESGTYALLVVYADPAHLAAIVDSVQLHH